jgi:2'-hydroxyisoflavone reductase
MKILIVGGTKFFGRHLVTVALARGHRITLFHRGKTNPHLFPVVEKLCGDRDGNLDLLKGRSWDAVIDTCGYIPAQVEATASALKTSTGHYTFISSISVYGDFGRTGMDENSGLAALPPGVNPNENNGEYYGAKKALCEQVVERQMPGKSLNIRPGIIVGPYDFTNRLAYWLERVARGGEVLCPAPPEARVQLIDARDLAEWTLHMVETLQTGAFNVTGPADSLTFKQMLDACHAASGSDASLVWMDEKFLLERGVKPFSDLPFWLPASDKSHAGFFSVHCSRALKNGLMFRPLTDTACDVLAEMREHGNHGGEPQAARLPPGREAGLLRAWKAKLV